MTIGIIPTIAPYLLPKVLPTLKRLHPHFELSVVEKQTERLIEQVRYGHIDTAIIALPYPLDGLHAFEFWAEDFLQSYLKMMNISTPIKSTATIYLRQIYYCLVKVTA